MRLPFAKYFERRSVHLSGFTTLGDLHGPSTAAGITVTPERALSVPAVYGCISVLSQDIAKTPIKLRQRVAADAYEDATGHDLYEILGALANPETSAYTFKHQMMFDLLVHERAYAEIIREEGRVSALWRLDPTAMTIDRDDHRRKRYRYTGAGGQTEWLFDASRPPLLELSHPSPLRYCRDLIGTALALQRYTGKFFSNGARLGGVLQTDHVLSDVSATRLRESFDAHYGGLANAHRTAVLEDGVKFQQVSAPNDDAQLNETLKTIRNEICGVFRIPPFKISDLSQSNYSNVEALSIEYTTGTLDPWFTIWEQAIRRDLLTVRQYGSFDVTFDRAALIRSDTKSQHDALAVGRQNGIYSANDCRRALGLNPIAAADGGDAYLVNGNMTPAVQTEQDRATSVMRDTALRFNTLQVLRAARAETVELEEDRTDAH